MNDHKFTLNGNPDLDAPRGPKSPWVRVLLLVANPLVPLTNRVQSDGALYFCPPSCLYKWHLSAAITEIFFLVKLKITFWNCDNPLTPPLNALCSVQSMAT